MERKPENRTDGIRVVSAFFRRYFNGSKGVISLFLAILMVPFVSVAGALINAARINSAVAVFDEALCNASNSTLGTYDTFLKSRFGLLAMSQDTSARGGGYTIQSLISDTFEEYMRVNVGALSNTYFNVETTATGIYPLSDSDVLYTQVNEYGKYAIPTELVINGLSLDSILDSLTSGTKMAQKIFGVVDSSLGVVDSFYTADEKLDSLSTSVATANTRKEEKDTSYQNFSNAVSTYNSAVDARATALAKCEAAISSANTAVNEAETALAEQAEKEEAKVLVERLLEMEDGDTSDEEIAAFKETNKDVLKNYLDAREELKEAKEDLATAKTDKSTKEETYKTEMAGKRTALKNARDEYAIKLGEYAEAIKNVGNGAIEARDALLNVAQSGVAVAGNVADCVAQSSSDAGEEQVKSLEKQLNDARTKNDTAAVNKLEQQIAQTKANNVETKQQAKLGKEKIAAVKTQIGSTATFYDRDFSTEYDGYYRALVELQSRTEGYTVPDEDTKKGASASGYQTSVNVGLTEEEVRNVAKSEGERIASASFFGLAKALIGFVEALFSLSIWYNWELTGTVDGSYYSEQGGLPSQRDRLDSRYSLKSEYDQEDKEQSENYKRLLSAYQGDYTVSYATSDFMNSVNNILSYMNTIKYSLDNLASWDFFHHAAELIKALWGIVTELKNLIDKLTGLGEIKEAVYQKMLLAGYIGYNTPNRTTYTGSALTGAKYSDSLPGLGDRSGMGFWGAETEYIISGGSSEIDNQTRVFYGVYAVRLITDLAFVFTNREVNAFFEAATAATAVVGGWGGLLVYLVYCLAEPLVDTILMVNGSTVPIIKTTLFLTSQGILSLAEKIVKIPLREESKASVQKNFNNVVKEVFPGGETVSLDNNPTEQPSTTGDKMRDAFSVDYTKTLILLMMLFSSEDILKRLGDVIQMEATCKSRGIGSYPFNLDQSYTYLRVAGQFDAHDFIKLSGTGILTSTNRVVYRGY